MKYLKSIKNVGLSFKIVVKTFNKILDKYFPSRNLSVKEKQIS